MRLTSLLKLQNKKRQNSIAMNEQALLCNYFQSPIGIIQIIANQEAIQSIRFVNELAMPINNSNIITNAISQLNEYFLGSRKIFDLPILSTSGTTFQNEVWNTLLSINYAKQLTYQELARKINRPKAQQAVGQACGRNPLAIVVPCHRVVAASGNLQGYAYGLDRKAFLLKLEQTYESKHS